MNTHAPHRIARTGGLAFTTACCLGVLSMVAANPDPLASWRFEEGQAGQAVVTQPVWDLSDNGNHMTRFSDAAAPTYVEDVPFDTVPQTGEANNLALSFAGPNVEGAAGQDVLLADGPLRTYRFNEWTIEVSFQANNPGEGGQSILGKDGDPLGFGPPPITVRLDDFSGELEVGLVDGAGNWHVLFTEAPQAGEWYSVAATATATEMRLYVKGPEDEAYALRGNPRTINGAFYLEVEEEEFDREWTIGRGMQGGEFEFFEGLIDEVRISSEALSPSQFLATAGNAAEVLGSTLAYWRFEEGEADTQVPGVRSQLVDDHSGNGNHMRTFAGFSAPTYVSEVPFDPIPLTGEENTLAMNFSPVQDLFTESRPINSFEFEEWTVEAMFLVNTATAFQGIVGKDGHPFATEEPEGAREEAPPFFIKTIDNGRLELGLLDGAGQLHLIESIEALTTARWYRVAATATATEMALWLKGPGDEDYVLQGTADIDGAFLSPEDFADPGDFDSSWTIGRGMWNGGVGQWFNGMIDEVRVYDVALEPTQFLAEGEGVPPEPENIRYWANPGTGAFGEAANWDPQELPGEEDFAFMGPVGTGLGTGGTAELDGIDFGAVAGLRIGQDDSSSLLITNGGRLTANADTFIGRNDGGVGLLSITGADSSFTTANSLTILGMGAGEGVEASGILEVGDGGTYTHAGADLFIVGDNVNSGRFDGTLNVDAGGAVEVTDSGGQLWLGQGGTGEGTGTANVSGTLTAAGNFNVGNAGGTGVLNLLEGGQVTASANLMVGNGPDSTGMIEMTGGTLNRTDGGITIVADLGATGTVNQSGGTFNVDAGEFWIGASGGSTGTYNLDGGEINHNSDWFIIGQWAGDGTLNMTDGTITRTGGGNFVLASQPFSTGTLNQSGGLIDLQSGNMEVAVFDGTSGVATISGNAVLDTHQGFVHLAVANETAEGTLNLAGGTLRTTQITSGPGTSIVNFDGGLLRANAGNESFIAGLTEANIGEGGMNIDTNGFDLTVDQDFAGEGGVGVSGSGSLTLNGTLADLAGVDVVDTATLKGTGTLGGLTSVAAGATLSPGASIGTLNLGSAAINGNWRVEFDGDEIDMLNVDQTLDIGDGTISFERIGDELGGPAHVFASYGSLAEGYQNVTLQNVPQGYAIDFDYQGDNQIALVTETPVDPDRLPEVQVRIVEETVDGDLRRYLALETWDVEEGSLQLQGSTDLEFWDDIDMTVEEVPVDGAVRTRLLLRSVVLVDDDEPRFFLRARVAEEEGN